MPPGEFFTMVGPSGCGKTTTLRMIAGFERPTSGRILLDGEDVAQTPPHRRNVNTVFQSYALFPHLNVADNVAFGLKYKKVTKAERAHAGRRGARARAARPATRSASPGSSRAASSSASRWPARSCCARACCCSTSRSARSTPACARTCRSSSRRCRRTLGITFVFVTHDQEEALTMSDRVAVMNGGRVEQSGPPQEMYEEPATLFVADFLGVSNLVARRGRGPDGRACMLKVGDVPMRADRRARSTRAARSRR